MRLLGDLRDARLMILKAMLFVAGLLLAAGGLIAASPSWQTAVLTLALIWCAARAYYFLFYVITHYVDDSYHYSGLWSALTYLASRSGRERCGFGGNRRDDDPQAPKPSAEPPRGGA
jgi:hypothetical protein